MSFEGFSHQTREYFFGTKIDNSKAFYEKNKPLYLENVKAPLLALHQALTPIVLNIDPDICTKPARCISGVYNDARFSKAQPIKTYMYLHFCASTGRDTDIPGLFMDASDDGYRYGLHIYHQTTKGMQMLRDAALADEKHFTSIIKKLTDCGIFTLEGQDYKKDHYPDMSSPIKGWLNKKSWFLQHSEETSNFESPKLADELADGFKLLSELYQFYIKALSNGYLGV